jgi:signal transduction histidine kinase
LEALLSNEPAFEEKSTHLRLDFFDKLTCPFSVRNRCVWPIRVTGIDVPPFYSRQLNPIGVIRISNFQRYVTKNATQTADFSRFDAASIAFISEVLFYLFQQYIQFINSQTDFARLTHGLGATIDASLKFCLSVQESLFDESEGDIKPKAKFALNNRVDQEGIYHDLRDLKYFLEDLSFQFSKSQGLNYEPELIDRFHTEVLMPTLRLSPAIAAVNNKKPPRFNDLKSVRSLQIPRIAGNRNAYIMILRNLIENSVKYSKAVTAEISISFSQNSDHVIIDYRDSGIGVPPDECEQIFVEGYRSVEARIINNRGIGVGLTFSRDTIRELDGDLVCLPSNTGAHFRLFLRRAA